MTSVKKIEEILSKYWSDVYDICDTQQECIDYIYSNSVEDEEKIINEEWDVFTDMVDDAFYSGFTTNDDISYNSMEK